MHLTMEGQPGGAGDAELWVRARDILDRALSLPEASRASYLDQACGADAELRREVESLLAVADRPAFSDRPAPADPGATITMQGAAAAGTPILPGQRISHYQIASKIGEGGMGAVYRAIDTNLGRTVALKVISRPFISADDKRRFAREAKAASALNHANIVTIYEYNSDHGIDFIAMEFVEGSALDKLLKQGGTPLSTLLDYARQVAGALAKAHAAGIAHRDLKPGNIMITGDGVVKVLDFGLAKQSRDAEGGEGTVTMALTQIGAVLGTPSYMSPEQAMGEPADFRSDIFSFGIILYELVCGRRPCQGSDAQTTLRQIVYKEPSPVEEVNQSLPQDLAALIAECLRKDREQRLQSMGDASERLRSIAEAPAATATATAAPTPAASPSIRFPWRRVAKWSLWAAAGIAIAAGGVRWGPRMIQRTALLAPDSFQQYQKATALLKKKYRKSYLDEAITTLDQAIAANPKHAASYAALAEAYVARYEGANDPQWLKLAADSAQKAAELDPDLSAAQAVVGLTAMVQQSYEKADAALQRALELDPQNARA